MEISMPFIFDVVNYNDEVKSIDLFSSGLKEYQIAKLCPIGADKNIKYDDFLFRISSIKPEAISLIRIEFTGPSDSVVFSRKIGEAIITKTIPLELLNHVNTYTNNIVYIECVNGGLLLDGNTTITLRNGFSNRAPFKIYLYPTTVLAPQDAETSFLNFVKDQYNSFYDFISLRNATLDSQKFSLFFTDKGVISDNQNIEITSNNFSYSIGDKVQLWKAHSQNQTQLSEPIYIGENHQEYKANPTELHGFNFVIPIQMHNQFSVTLAVGIDGDGREVKEFNAPVYSSLLRAQTKIDFTMFKNVAPADKDKMIDTGIKKQTIYVGVGHDIRIAKGEKGDTDAVFHEPSIDEIGRELNEEELNDVIVNGKKMCIKFTTERDIPK